MFTQRGYLMGKYVVSRNDRKRLIVSRGVHAAIKVYARDNGITMVEATFRLLRAGIIKIMGFEVEE